MRIHLLFNLLCLISCLILITCKPEPPETDPEEEKEDLLQVQHPTWFNMDSEEVEKILQLMESDGSITEISFPASIPSISNSTILFDSLLEQSLGVRFDSLQWEQPVRGPEPPLACHLETITMSHPEVEGTYSKEFCVGKCPEGQICMMISLKNQKTQESRTYCACGNLEDSEGDLDEPPPPPPSTCHGQFTVKIIRGKYIPTHKCRGKCDQGKKCKHATRTIKLPGGYIMKRLYCACK